MKNVLDYIANLVSQYKYKKLPEDLSRQTRIFYERNLPILDSTKPIYFRNGKLFAKKFDRVVIGDYGAFIEISDDDIAKENVWVDPKHTYRFDDKYKNVKYYKYIDETNSYIYHQKNTVSYADYLVGKWYISPYEIVQK